MTTNKQQSTVPNGKAAPTANATKATGWFGAIAKGYCARRYATACQQKQATDQQSYTARAKGQPAPEMKASEHLGQAKRSALYAAVVSLDVAFASADATRSVYHAATTALATRKAVNGGAKAKSAPATAGAKA